MEQTGYPIILTIPHASNLVPAHITPALALNEAEIYNSWDLGSRELYQGLPAQWIYKATYSRIVVDLNRSPGANGPRGVIPLVDYSGRLVYRKGAAPGPIQRQERLKLYYWPYHRLIEEQIQQGNVAGLMDCHTLNGIGPRKAPDFGKKRPDIVLGNNGDSEGEPSPSMGETTCDAKLIRQMARILRGLGFDVKINQPYPGGYVVVHYGRLLKKKGGFGIQMEVNQDLFSDPITGVIEPPRIEELGERLKHFLSKVFELL